MWQAAVKSVLVVDPMQNGRERQQQKIVPSEKIITTSAEVTPNGGLVRESTPKSP